MHVFRSIQLERCLSSTWGVEYSTLVTVVQVHVALICNFPVVRPFFFFDIATPTDFGRGWGAGSEPISFFPTAGCLSTPHHEYTDSRVWTTSISWVFPNRKRYPATPMRLTPGYECTTVRTLECRHFKWEQKKDENECRGPNISSQKIIEIENYNVVFMVATDD